MLKAWPCVKLCMALLPYQIPSRNLKNMAINFVEKYPGFMCNPRDDLWSYPMYSRNHPMTSKPWRSFEGLVKALKCSALRTL